MVNFYEFLMILEQQQQYSDVMLPNDLVDVSVPRFGGMSEYVRVSPRKMLLDMKRSVRNVNGVYHLFDNDRNFLVYKNPDLNQIIKFLTEDYIKFLMGSIRVSGRSAFGGGYKIGGMA